MLGQPKKAAASALILAALAFGACGDSEGSGSGDNGSGSGSASASGAHEHESTLATFPAAEAEVTVDVTMRDFKFDMPAEIKAGKVLFKVKNTGSQEHEFVIMQGSEELGEVHSGSGKDGQLAVVLPAGRYTAKCLIGSGAARHDKLGMVHNFTVA